MRKKISIESIKNVVSQSIGNKKRIWIFFYFNRLILQNDYLHRRQKII